MNRVILNVMDYLVLPQGRYPEISMFISLLEVCQEGGSQEGGGYLEDAENSWPETWMTGLSLMSYMTLFDP